MIDYKNLEYEKENPNVDGAMRLFLAITLQAVDDINKVSKMLSVGYTPNEEDKADYQSAIEYFIPGNGFDYWLTLLTLEGHKWEELREEILHNRQYRGIHKPYVREDKTVKCEVCGIEFVTKANHIKFCINCRKQKMKDQQRIWRTKNREKYNEISRKSKVRI